MIATAERRRAGALVRLVYRAIGAETRIRAHEAAWGYIFAVPWILGLTVFVAGPIIVSLGLSMSQYNILKPPKFIGVDNYTTAFFQDELFWPSLGRTFKYALAVVPLGMVGSLILAMFLNQELRGTTIFRTIFFIPHLTPTVAMAILWKWIFHPGVGPLNHILRTIGIANPPGWLSSPPWAIPSLVLVSLWSGMGGNRMLIFLAGLQGVPVELYEAAEIDGAGAISKFRHVTLPMISPTILFNLILNIIGALQVFAMAFVATMGGPSWATWFYALHLYRSAFQYFKMGYGCALAWILVIILMTFTVLQLRLSQKWVYYEGGSAA